MTVHGRKAAFDIISERIQSAGTKRQISTSLSVSAKNLIGAWHLSEPMDYHRVFKLAAPPIAGHPRCRASALRYSAGRSHILILGYG
jgi:hypothetical protein